MSPSREPLEQLARLCGVQPSYEDVTGQVREASDATLVRLLASLDAPIERPQDAAEALRHMRERRWARAMEPVTVHLEGHAGALGVRLPVEALGGAYRLEIVLEEGSVRTVEGRCDNLPIDDEVDVEGRRFVRGRLTLPADVPRGYHRLVLSAGGRRAEGWLLRAPARVWLPDGDERTWGLFAPTYALRGPRSWGAGNLSDLATLAGQVESLGGGVMGTLPLLASFLDEPYDPSPYAPVSRLAWNELFLDLTRVPEWSACLEARRMAASEEWKRVLGELRAAPLVDYRRQWLHMRPVLARLARHAFEQPDTRAELERYAATHPHIEGYARFRAIMAAQGDVWARWPERLRAGRTTSEDGLPDVFRTFLYAQWRLSDQLDDVAKRAKRHGPGLYLDLPLGVHPDGYDAWHEQEAFMPATGAGAPPDDFFTLGQSWGFAPLHPRHIRERGYDYLAACFRSQLSRAGMLRIDHVMWLHRLFCIPDGMEATQGAYVRYRPEEMYAVLALESQRHRSVIVGEDLGTVPDEVRRSMADKGVLRMFVFQFEAGPDHLGEVPRDSVASLNTHDMPPFAAWWSGRDVDDRVDLGFLDPRQAETEHGQRAEIRDYLRRRLGVGQPGGDPDEDMDQVVQAVLERLAESPARVVLVNAEDLWLERWPQNVPGTGPERPNWRGKSKLTVDQMQVEDNVITCLHRIDERRRA